MLEHRQPLVKAQAGPGLSIAWSLAILEKPVNDYRHEGAKMESESLDSLLERSNGTDVPLLLRAKEVAKRRVKDDPTAANLSALSRVTEMLSKAMGDNTNFKNANEVWKYLRECGRKIGHTKFYQEVGKFIRPQKDGTFRRRDVDAYAKTLPLVVKPERELDEMGDLARRDVEEKIAKTIAQRQSIELDRRIKEGKYILRDDVTLELASRAAALDMNLRSVFRLFAPDFIRLSGGDPNKAEEVIQAFERQLDSALTEYSRPMDFETNYVPVEKTETAESDGNSDADAPDD